MGKRQLGQLEPSELVVTILISELAAVPMQDPEVPLLYGVIPMIVLLAMEVLISGLAMRHIRFRTLLCGKPNIIMWNGEICQKTLEKCRINMDELVEELRLQGTLDFKDVQYMILETNGQMSIIQRSYAEPLSKNDYGISPDQKNIPIPIISNGRILEENMRKMGKDKQWLQNALNKQGFKSYKDIFWFTIDKNDNEFVIKKEHQSR